MSILRGQSINYCHPFSVVSYQLSVIRKLLKKAQKIDIFPITSIETKNQNMCKHSAISGQLFLGHAAQTAF